MPPRPPPLAALRTFEAAARHGNFSRAADELHLTHGAISHQIKSLEQTVGVALFRRGRRGVTLTAEGASLAAVMRDALERIARGVEAVRVRPPRALTISVLPAFATHWLIPRLGDFQARHPEIEVNIRAGQDLVDFSRDDVDLAVRYGPGTWPGLVATRLMGEDVFPVCSRISPGENFPGRCRIWPERRCCTARRSPGTSGSWHSACRRRRFGAARRSARPGCCCGRR